MMLTISNNVFTSTILILLILQLRQDRKRQKVKTSFGTFTKMVTLKNLILRKIEFIFCNRCRHLEFYYILNLIYLQKSLFFRFLMTIKNFDQFVIIF